MEITYLTVPPKRYTFENDLVRRWVEKHCKGQVLNLFAGKTSLNVLPYPVRNDSNPDMPAAYHLDAFEMIQLWRELKYPPFDTIVLDPPYSERKAMEFYQGYQISQFQKVKEAIPHVLASNGRVITFGYNSTGMGRLRGFKKTALLILNHYGAYHETYGTVDEYQFKIDKNMVGLVEDSTVKKLSEYIQEANE